MKGRSGCVSALVAVVSLALVASLHAQAKKDPKTGLYRIEGSVEALHKDKSQVTVKEHSSINVTWSVSYTKDTAFTWGNKDGKADDVKVGEQVVVLGKIPDPGKPTHLEAVRFEIRSR